MSRQNDDLCRCGHRYEAHQHFRRGTDCSLCPARDCLGFVAAGSLRARIATLRHR